MLEQARFKAACHRLLDFIIDDTDMREMTIEQIKSMLQIVGNTIPNCANRIPIGTLIQAMNKGTNSGNEGDANG